MNVKERTDQACIDKRIGDVNALSKHDTKQRWLAVNMFPNE